MSKLKAVRFSGIELLIGTSCRRRSAGMYLSGQEAQVGLQKWCQKRSFAFGKAVGWWLKTVGTDRRCRGGISGHL